MYFRSVSQDNELVSFHLILNFPLITFVYKFTWVTVGANTREHKGTSFCRILCTICMWKWLKKRGEKGKYEMVRYAEKAGGTWPESFYFGDVWKYKRAFHAAHKSQCRYTKLQILLFYHLQTGRRPSFSIFDPFQICSAVQCSAVCNKYLLQPKSRGLRILTLLLFLYSLHRYTRS